MEMAAAIVILDGQHSGLPDCYTYALGRIGARAVAIACFWADTWYKLGSGRGCKDMFGLPLHSY
ncbi:hypothetical protein BDW72DRAFT_170931 [Aspergillus terricola var. indicus]